MKNYLYGEILYTGFVIEKNRHSNKLLRHGYLKSLRYHSLLWKRIINRMMERKEPDQDRILITDFLQLLGTDHLIGRYYPTPIHSLAEIERVMNTDDGKEESLKY
ncbi:hypothetical protein [Cohnella soli]|uniref:Uncharacterized protein n=1 Tax=Cohnella soli TaxID=425005 RepID=A0ABW0HU30_9BACL